MDFYQDLTYYNRFHYENAQNVGFGRIGTEKTQVQLPYGFLPQLLKYLKYPLNTTRGGLPRRVTIDGENYTLGFSEIRVLGKDGRVFAAPNDIVGYIQDSVYNPPAVFVDAVMTGIDPDSDAYRAYLERYSAQYCWGASNAYVGNVISLVEMISQGNLAGVRAQLEEQKALLEIVTGNGSLLNEAITQKQEKIAEYLIEAGICLKKFEGEELLTAVECGMESIVRLLLEKGMPIKMDRPRNNPLFLAIGRKQNKIAEYLYMERRDLVVVYNTEFAQNCNILQWTKMCKNTAFMNFLEKLF